MASLEETYQQFTSLELVLKKPAMFIGTMDPEEQRRWVYNASIQRMEFRKLVYSHGLLQIFLEILMNACDHAVRTEKSKYPLSEIKVWIDAEKNLIIVQNNGEGIPVVEHPKHKVLIPEMLFSQFASSSNYREDEERVVSGTHGIGAKASVVFSTWFKVETLDAERGLKFSQVYENNLTKIHPAVISKTEGKPYTRIAFKADLERFGAIDNCLDEDIVAIMEKSVVDVCALTNKRVNVYLNGEKLAIKDFEHYVKLYIEPNTPVVFEEQGEMYHWKYSICQNTFDGFRQVSFVNGVPTPDGGTHIEYLLKQIVDYLTEQANKRAPKGCKVKELDIRNNIFLFLSATIKNATFSSQTKHRLSTSASNFGCKPQVSNTFLKAVANKTGIIDASLRIAEFKQQKQLDKTDGKKKSNIGFIPKLVDANWAGTTKSDRCILILTEGDSAKSAVLGGIRDRNIYGVFPLRGKLINVRERSTNQISQNEEIQNLKKILGLGKDTRDPKELRYGKVMLLTDADVDGSHIKGLIINFFNYYWLPLLEGNQFLTCMATPILKATKGKQIRQFYSLSEYQDWRRKTAPPELARWDLKYYKGLGTSTKSEFQEYFKDPKIISFQWDGQPSTKAIELAFSKSLANARKDWLREYDPDKAIDFAKKEVSYPEFVNEELKHFSNADNIRSIPSLMDGLKPSLRKIIYACFLKGLLPSKREIKVAQLAGFVSEKTSYHHGEASLQQAIVGLAQTFVGSNNINLLQPIGQFGTRLQGGKDSAQPRYIFTKLSEACEMIFNQSDAQLLKYLDDDGEPIEPLYYVPTIPMILVNGAKGIGTGYSTFVPNYKPTTIIYNLMMMLNKTPEKMKPLVPYYEGFGGIIKPNTGDPKSYVCRGNYTRNGSMVHITELPIGIWTDDYKEFLAGHLTDGKKSTKTNFIKKIKDNSSDTDIDITLELTEDAPKDIEKALKLATQISIKNMYLYNEDNIIQKYETPEAILQDYYNVRLRFYVKRRDHLIAQLKADILILDNKARFILMVVENKLRVMKVPSAEVEAQLIEHKFDKHNNSYDYLLQMAIRTLTKERIDELKKQVEKKKAELAELEKKTSEDLWGEDLTALYETILKENK